jgi:acetyl esterase/lipase
MPQPNGADLIMKVNYSDFETLPTRYDFPGLIGKTNSLQKLIKFIVEYNSTNPHSLGELFQDVKKYPMIQLIKHEGFNLLELAVFRCDSGTVRSVLQHTADTELKLTNTVAHPHCNACVPNENPPVNGLINAIRFSDFDLLLLLSTRTVPGMQIIEKPVLDIKLIGENPICFSLRRPHDQSFFKRLLARTQAYISMPCRSKLSPLNEAIKLGYKPDYELKHIVKQMCNTDSACLTKLLCEGSTAIDDANALANNTDTLEFFYNNGGKQCWHPRYDYQPQLPQAKQLSTETSNAINTSASTCILGICINPLILLTTLLVIGLGLVYWHISNRNNRNTRLETAEKMTVKASLQRDQDKLIQIDAEFIKFTIAELFNDARFSNLDYNGWFGIKNKQSHYRLMSSRERQEFISKKFSSLYHLAPYTDVERDLKSLPEGYERIPKLRRILAKDQPENKITFYIPGTASVTTNAEIELCIGTHLAYALHSSVLIIDHDLAPETPWPFNLIQVCRIIKHFIDNNPKVDEYILAGFSTGGYFATFIPFILGRLNQEKYRFNRLILFAPMEDCGAELRHPQYTEWNERQLAQLPIPSDFKDDPVGKLKILRALIDPKDYFESNFAGLHECLIKDCFPKYKKQEKGLREVSPLWFDNASFNSDLFPDTTIIVGQRDCFRIDSELFYAKLKDSNCKVTKIVLPAINHGLIWKSIYPIYLAQPIIRPRKNDNPSFNDIIKSDQALMINARDNEEGSVIANDHLTEEAIPWRTRQIELLCQSYNWLRKTNDPPQHPVDNISLDVPIYSFYEP